MAGSVGGVGRARAAASRSGTDDRILRVFPTARRCVLFYGVVAAAVAAVVLFVTVADQGGMAVGYGNLLVAVTAFTAGQLARVEYRVGSDVVMLGWGEVGVVAALCLVPAPWVPVAVAIGGVLGHASRLVGADSATRTRVVYGVSALTTGAAVATVVVAVAAVLVGPADRAEPVRVDIERPATFVPLLLASLSHFVVTSLLASAWVASTTRGELGSVWLRVARGKRVMLAGNIAVGLAVAFVIAVGAIWLAPLAPVLWVLHLGYAHQMRSVQERDTWVALAEATRGLNQLDEGGVVNAALRGAAQLFEPDEVEVVLRRPSVATSTVATAAGAKAPHAAVRRLVVGDVDIGELRLKFRRPVALGTSEQHAFSTFADAVASALHDAATHRQLQAMTARSAYDAVHDPLTGLSNRSTLFARGNGELRRGDPDRSVALILFDVDGLRAVNDALSHAAGDELLRVLAQRLADHQINGELLGRLGGDEFALLATGEIDSSAGGLGWTYALDRARSLISTLAVPARVSGVTIAVEASAGVVVDTASSCDMTELLRRADVALHRAKREGVRVARYDPTNDASSTGRLAVLADFRDALSTTDQLTLYLQPAVDLVTGAPVSAEALLRWRHPNRGLLRPGDFIGAIEHSDLAAGLTRHVLDLALRIAAGWATQGIHIPISVNLCARCMVDPELPAGIAAMLAAHAVSPGRLILEITETVTAAELDLVEGVIAGLRAAGVQVSVDDFGTGSASLSFLTRFPVDEVKIDRTFVAAMVESPETAAIVRATVDLAAELGLRVVAEGVERPEQRAALVGLGVTAAQGFLFHPPLRLEEATATLQGMAHVATMRSIPIVRAPSP